MKHIARRFQGKIVDPTFIPQKHEGEQIIPQGKNGTLNKKQKKELTGKGKFTIYTLGGDLHIGYADQIDGKVCLFPHPDPTWIHFANAQEQRRRITEIWKELRPLIDVEIGISDKMIHLYYQYYGAVCGFTIYLSIALESFMNSILKEEDIYIAQRSEGPKEYKFAQIQRSLPYGEKIKQAIPQLRGMDFISNHSNEAQLIHDLKQFRDSIVHTKKKTNFFTRDFIIELSFKLKYDKTIEAVAAYMNFYKPGYIVECDCGKDF